MTSADFQQQYGKPVVVCDKTVVVNRPKAMKRQQIVLQEISGEALNGIWLKAGRFLVVNDEGTHLECQEVNGQWWRVEMRKMTKV